MLKTLNHSPTCVVKHCEYYLDKKCSLNIKSDSNYFDRECKPTDNWYITGSYVLDKVFQKETAHDIDLVMPDYEKPRTLPNEVLESPLAIDTLWGDIEKERHHWQYYNISLPKITINGRENWNVVDSFLSEHILRVLPRIRRLPTATLFNAIKSLVKYDLEMDDTCFQIWNKSILNPPSWRSLTLWIIKQQYAKENMYDWNMVKASHLTYYFSGAFNNCENIERELYENKVLEILDQMDFKADIGSLTFFKYVQAAVSKDIKEKQRLEELMRAHKTIPQINKTPNQ